MIQVLRDPRSKPNYWLYRVSAFAALLAVVSALATVLYIIFSRIRYPFALELVEGETLVQVSRVLQGKSLYVEPSYRYVAMVYPPLYFYVAAVFSRVIGAGFFPLRLVSLVSSLGCLSTIYLICRKEGTTVLPAVIASGLFAGTYALGGSWFEIARVDMLAVFLVLLAVYLSRFKSLAAYTVAGIVFAMACLAKQTNLFILAMLCLYFILFERGASLAFVVSSLACFGFASWRLDQVSSGWYSYFVYRIVFAPGGAPALTPSIILDSLTEFWWDSLLLPLPIALILIAGYLRIQVPKWKSRTDNSLVFYAFLSAGMLGTSWAAFIHPGGDRNVLIPAYAILAILLGLSVQELSLEMKSKPLAQTAVLLGCTVQLAMLTFPIRTSFPTRADFLAGQSLVAEIHSMPGKVYVHFHPELALLAGKPTYADWVSTYQLGGGFGGGDLMETNRVKSEFAQAMARHEFSMIVLDKDPTWVWGHPERYYSLSQEPVFSDPRVFWPVTGFQIRPTAIMYPTQP